MPRRAVVALHACFWVTYVVMLLAILTVAQARGGAPPAVGRPSALTVVGLAALTLPYVATFYASYVGLFPIVRRRRGWYAIAGYSGLTFGLAALASFAILYLGAGAPPLPLAALPSFAAFALCLGALAALHGGLALGLRGFIAWYGDLRQREERERRAHELELALLRSRLDPHFLFNTLNNIDALIERDPAAASAYLQRLSELMRYVLFEAPEATRVPLATELAHLERYMEIEALRHANPGHATFDVVCDPAGVTVPPTLFTPFIETAFKHAARGDGGAAQVRVRCEVGASEVTFRCANRCRPAEDKRAAHVGGGLGHALVRRRLELLYPRRHALEVGRAGGDFLVSLTIRTHDDDPLPDR
jgi:hypothetical protein